MIVRPLSNRQRVLLSVTAVVSLVLLLAAGYVASQEQYTIYDGLEPVVVRGNFDQVSEVLAAAGLALATDDVVLPELTAVPDPHSAIQIRRAQPIILRTEAGQQTRRTHQATLAGFLDEAGILVRRTDQILADGRRISFGELDETPLPAEVEIGHFLTVTIDDGIQQRTLRTAAQTVGGALAEAGVRVYAADGVEPSLGSWLSPNMAITVQRSQPINVVVDGRLVQTRSHHRNALDVLAEAGIGLIGYDYTRPGPDIPLQSGDTIEVIRVTEDFRVEDEPIPFDIVWQGTDQLELDQRALLSQGQPGILRHRIRVRYENGVAVSETVDGEWVALEPVSELMGFGTNVVIRTVDTPEGPREYWRKVRMRVTSYSAATSGKEPDHPAYGITRSGLPSGYGIVAVDPAVVPFRSQVFVPGYGVAMAGDTGGGVKGRWIDLGYPDGELRHWSGYVDVYYLTPVPSQINYRLPTWLP